MVQRPMMDYDKVETIDTRYFVSATPADDFTKFTKKLRDPHLGLQLLDTHERRHELVAFGIMRFRGLFVDGNEWGCHYCKS